MIISNSMDLLLTSDNPNYRDFIFEVTDILATQNITRTVLLPKTGVYHIIAVGGGGSGGVGSLGKGGGAVRSGGGGGGGSGSYFNGQIGLTRGTLTISFNRDCSMLIGETLFLTVGGGNNGTHAPYNGTGTGGAGGVIKFINPSFSVYETKNGLSGTGGTFGLNWVIGQGGAGGASQYEGWGAGQNGGPGTHSGVPGKPGNPYFKIAYIGY